MPELTDQCAGYGADRDKIIHVSSTVQGTAKSAILLLLKFYTK